MHAGGPRVPSTGARHCLTANCPLPQRSGFGTGTSEIPEDIRVSGSPHFVMKSVKLQSFKEGVR